MRNTGILIGVAALLVGGTALAADCETPIAGKAFSVNGTVAYVDAANDVVAGMGYKTVVSINDRKRGCIINVQAKRVSGCAKGKTATAKGTAFVVPFTPVVLSGADSVQCR